MTVTVTGRPFPLYFTQLTVLLYLTSVQYIKNRAAKVCCKNVALGLMVLWQKKKNHLQLIAEFL